MHIGVLNISNDNNGSRYVWIENIYKGLSTRTTWMQQNEFILPLLQWAFFQGELTWLIFYAIHAELNNDWQKHSINSQYTEITLTILYTIINTVSLTYVNNNNKNVYPYGMIINEIVL